MSTLYIILFFLFSALLLAFTLSRPYRHRYYRFAAFESLLALVFLNASQWFADPLSLRQLVSWGLLAGSLFLAVHGFSLLKTIGSPAGDIENTTQLVAVGAYRYIRHPLYASLLLAGLGALLKDPTPLSTLAALALGTAVYATARVEEAENLIRFGTAYREYMQQTKMFLPFIL